MKSSQMADGAKRLSVRKNDGQMTTGTVYQELWAAFVSLHNGDETKAKAELRTMRCSGNPSRDLQRFILARTLKPELVQDWGD